MQNHTPQTARRRGDCVILHKKLLTLYKKLPIGGRQFAFWRVPIYILEDANLHFEGSNCLGGAFPGVTLRSPRFGVCRRGLPRFVPISPFSSDLFRFAFLVFWEYPDLFRFAPFSSDLFRFVFRTNQKKSGKPLSADPFANPRTLQTKPKKGQFMNFSRGHSGTKARCESRLFSPQRRTRIHKNVAAPKPQKLAEMKF